MKRFTLIAAILGTLVFAGQSTSQAAYAYRRPAVRVARRAFVYRPRYVVPRYYGPRPGYYYGPGYYRGVGPGWYGPGLGFGPGVAVGVF